MDVDTGIVTLLFTDIEGSTEKWEQEPSDGGCRNVGIALS